ncbi:hypothetical protein CVAR21S_01572 [Corynebacterium variabile]
MPVSSVLGSGSTPTGRSSKPVLDFVDLEDIDGVFREPLPRISLDTLPDGGAWLQPYRSWGGSRPFPATPYSRERIGDLSQMGRCAPRWRRVVPVIVVAVIALLYLLVRDEAR